MDRTPTPQPDQTGDNYRLRAILESAVDFAIVVTDRQGLVTDWNTGAARMLGWTAGEMIGQAVDRFFTPEDRSEERVAREMQLSLETGRASDERWHLRKDGSRFWASGEMCPLRGAAGEHLGFLKIITDRTMAHLAGVALAESEERRRLAAEVGEVGLWDWDLDEDNLLLDARMKVLNGVSDGRDLSREALFEAIHPDDEARVGVELGELADGRRDDIEIQYRVIGIDDGIVRTVIVNGRRFQPGDGRPARLIGAARDITERVASDARRTMLNQELAHRLKNTLAIVTSIVTQTLRNAPDVESGRKTLLARIYALSKAHDMLLSGRQDSASVRSIILASVALHDEGGRVETDGPEVPLGPKAALTLSLIVHELATNAGKYGALAVPEGIVAVRWSVARGEDRLPVLSLDWTERDGPPVEAPKRNGFGTRLIQMGLSGSTGGRVEMEYPADGFRCRIVAPLVELVSEDEAEG